MLSWRLVAAWILALVVTTLITWQIVGLADSQVGDSPVVASLATTAPPTDSSTSVPTTNSSSSSSTAPSPSVTTSTTAPSSTSAESWSLRTVDTSGGSVVVRYRPGEVRLQAATPAPGYEVEIDDAGPPRVRVEFEGADSEVRVEIRWEDGGLDIEVSD